MKTRSILLLAILVMTHTSCLEQEDTRDTELKKMNASELVFESKGLKVFSTEKRIYFEDPYRTGKVFVIEGAIERIALSSTTQLVFFQELNALDKVIASPWLDFVVDEDVQERKNLGALVDITKGAGTDLEQLIALDPDIFLYDPRSSDHVARLEESGVRCLPFMEYAEKDALARTEWLKLIGLLSDKQSLARERMMSIRTRYEEEKNAVSEERGQVLFGSFYQGVWSAAGGASLIAGLIKDAGGELVLGGDDLASVDLDPEQFITLLQEADFIGMVQQGEMTRKEWLAMDPRLVESMIEDKVIFYCNTAEVDYFGKGILEPDQMLVEFKGIFSGEDQQGEYFQIAE